MQVIAFGHRKRVGKDTAARLLKSWLVQNTKFKVERCSFGDQVKSVAHRMFMSYGLETGVYYENHPEKKEQVLATVGKSPRQIWEDLGKYGRDIHPKVWVEMAFGQIDEDTDIVIITDLRDPEEAQITKDYKGFCVRIERDVPWGGPMDYKLKDYNQWDATIENNGIMKDFNRNLIELCRSLLGV